MIRFFLRLRREREFARELDEEIRTHLKMAVADRVARGESPCDAEQAVRKEFGDVARVKEATREIWHGGWLERRCEEVRFAFRTLWKKPAFTATVIAALTLGIGVNTAIFSVFDAVLLKPLPYSDPGTLVQVWNTRHGALTGPATSPAKLIYWRAQTDVFSDVAAFRSLRFNYTGGDTPEQLAATQVSESYFRVLGVPMVRGRTFGAKEDRPGGPKVAVISYNFWQHHLGGTEDVLGKPLVLSGDSYTIVGVVGRNFDPRDFGGNPDLWIPVQLDPNSSDQTNHFSNIARLKTGMTLAQAQARLAASIAAFARHFQRCRAPRDAARRDRYRSRPRSRVLYVRRVVFASVRSQGSRPRDIHSRAHRAGADRARVRVVAGAARKPRQSLGGAPP